MDGLGAFPARMLIDELIRRHGPEKAAGMLGLADAGELLTLAANLDSVRDPETN